MENLFFSKKAIAVRLAFLVLACVVAVGLVALFSLKSPWGSLIGFTAGGLSQIAAMLVLSRDAS